MELPKEIEEALKKEAMEKGIDEEILLIDKLCTLDPSTRLALYLERAKGLLEEVKKYFEKKDFVQASEKAWGACASIVKAYAEKKGFEHYRHVQLQEVMSKLISEMGGDRGLITGWSTCLRLHFYENFMTETDLKSSLHIVEEFIEYMEKIVLS